MSRIPFENDMHGGKKIGSMLYAMLEVIGVDIDAPVLGIHSIKEVGHVDEVIDN